MKSYQFLDENTGEIKNRFKYFPARPAEYRFDGGNGNFLYDETPLTDEKNKPLKEFSLIPIVWRVFDENLFGRGKNDTWVELFFVDSKNRVSHIMLNNSSSREFLGMSSKLYYEDLQLSQIVLTLTPEKVEKEVEKEGKKQKYTWYIAQCTFTPADPETVEMFQEFARDFPIYAERTLTSTAVYRFKSDLFHIPEEYHILPDNLIAIPESC